MGQPVVHFEVIGKDGDQLRSFYSDLSNINADGIGIGGGIGGYPESPSHVTCYVEVADVEAALSKAEHRGGSRVMGPDVVTEGVEIGLFTDPEGQVIGVIKSAS
jgi:predicted enzyme related to lactoylglutathione lyase